MLDVLRKINEWWDSGNVPQELVPPTRRAVFGEVADLLDDRRIVGIVGPRRTGKTTLMFQLMDMLVRERNVDPRNVLFFSCDDVELRGARDLIGEAVRLFFEDLRKKDYRAERCYVFIDEVHWAEDWELWLKRFYDLRYDIKFVVSGSSAAKMRRGQRASLAGRIVEFTLFPLGFAEFLRFSGAEAPGTVPLARMTYEGLKAVSEGVGPRRALELRRLLDEYLLVGGLPEWFETRNVRKWQRRIREDVIKRVVYDDIATLYGVKSASKVEAMLRLLSSLQSRAYSYNSISRALGIDNETAGQYVSYLKESFMIFELWNYAASMGKRLRRNYKYVLFDTGVRNALERVDRIMDADLGYIVEGAVQQHLIWSSEPGSVSYWREREEVDAVVEAGRDLVPIEVKYRSAVSVKDLAGLVAFMGSHRLSRGIVVTRDALELRRADGRELLLVPAWLFLAVCSPPRETGVLPSAPSSGSGAP